MRDYVIYQIRHSKWWGNMLDEYEGNPPPLEPRTDIELLEIYTRWC